MVPKKVTFCFPQTANDIKRSITLNKDFIQDYNNKSSSEYKKLEEKFNGLVSTFFAQHDFKFSAVHALMLIISTTFISTAFKTV